MNKDHTFCEECGEKISLLPADSSTDQMRSSADYAYQNADYLEAYTLYTNLLKTDPSDHRALFRKGLCAGHLSAGHELRVNEVLEGYRSALAALQANASRSDKNYVASEQADMRKAIIDFAIGNERTLLRVKSKPVFESRREAEQFASSVADCVQLFCAVDAFASEEAEKKRLFTARIEACDLGLKCAKLRYYDGRTDQNGKPTEDPVSFSAPKEYLSSMKNKRLDAVDSYNALPSIQAEADRLQAGIDAEKDVIEDYKDHRKAFLRSDKELKSRLNKLRLIVLGAAAFLVILFLILAITCGKLWLWIASGVCVLLGWAVYRIAVSRFEKKHFPADLLKLRSASRRSRKALRQKKGEQIKFKNKTMKK